MKKVLITGITGQDGIFITKEVLNNFPNSQILGVTRNINNVLFFKKLNSLKVQETKNINLINLNLLDFNETFKTIEHFKPDTVINFSGPSSVYDSFNPDTKIHETIEIIFNNLTDALIATKNLAKFFQASSSEMFGNNNLENLNELSNFAPNSPYAHAKLKNHNKVLLLNEKYDWRIFSGIMFNHESQFRDEKYLVMKIIKGAEKIKSNNLDFIEIGSLAYIRDWSYASDITKAVFRILQNGSSPVYNIGSGKGTSIEEVVNLVFNYFNLEYKNYIKVNSDLLRKGDPSRIVCDPKKISNELNWTASISISENIKRCIEMKF